MSKNKSVIALVVLLTISVMFNGALSAFVYANKEKLIEKNNEQVEEKEITIDNAFYTFDESFLIKLKDNSYLKIGINMGYDSNNKKLEKEIASSLPKLKDKSLSVFLNKDKNSFSNENIEKIKEELINQYNKVLLTGKINNIYFTELIQQ